MSRWTLRRQLVVLGLLATIVPLLVLLAVVFGTETETISEGNGAGGLEVATEDSVSIWVPVAAALLIAGAVVVVRGWANRAVRPIEEMTALADEIQAGSLDRRIAVDSGPEEVRRLARSFDHMLDRLVTASEAERRFVEDASHDMRTPLAALSARIEVALGRDDPADQRADLERCEADVARMQTTLDSLLSSARDRQTSVAQIDNDLAAIARRVADRQRQVTPDAAIEVTAPRSLRLGIDGPSVDRAVTNLVRNAVEHGGGASVDIDVVDHGDHVSLEVTDHGSGIAADRLDRVFERYEGDDHGIGLALVKQVADSYGGVSVDSPLVDGRGTRFVMRFGRERRLSP